MTAGDVLPEAPQVQTQTTIGLSEIKIVMLHPRNSSYPMATLKMVGLSMHQDD